MFILDIETTGLDGLLNGDKIVEVGVCELTGEGIVKKVYHSIVRHADIMEYKDAWVFKNTTLTPEDVLKGKPEKEVIEDLHKLLDGRFCTSYYVHFDFDCFIRQPPYNIRPIVPFDIKDLASEMFGRRAHAEEAYLKFCPEDPAQMGPREKHRALEDAYMESFLLRALWLELEGD